MTAPHLPTGHTKREDDGLWGMGFKYVRFLLSCAHNLALCMYDMYSYDTCSVASAGVSSSAKASEHYHRLLSIILWNAAAAFSQLCNSADSLGRRRRMQTSDAAMQALKKDLLLQSS